MQPVLQSGEGFSKRRAKIWIVKAWQMNVISAAKAISRGGIFTQVEFGRSSPTLQYGHINDAFNRPTIHTQLALAFPSGIPVGENEGQTLGLGKIKMSKESPAKAGREKAAVASAPVDPVAGKSVAEIFGEIVWLMSQDKKARELPIKDLEWLVMPPILLRQFHITYAPVPDGRTAKGEAVRKASAGAEQKPRLQPVGVELYAMCSDAVAAALDAAAPGKVALAMQDWRGGPNKRVVRKVVLSGASG